MAGAKIALSSTLGEFADDGNGNAAVNLPLTAADAGFAQQSFRPDARCRNRHTNHHITRAKCFGPNGWMR